MKILGVSLNHQLSMSGHITAVLSFCGKTLCGFRVLRVHWLSQDCVKQVFRSIVLPSAVTLNRGMENDVVKNTQV